MTAAAGEPSPPAPPVPPADGAPGSDPARPHPDPAGPDPGGGGAPRPGSGAGPAGPAVIAVDAMGGDHAPAEIVAGATAAAREAGIAVILAGRPGQLRPLLARLPDTAGMSIEPAEEAVEMSEGALATWRRPRSSIAVACQLVRRGQAGAVVSAGSTGAIVATAKLRLRTLPGVSRPALAVALPTRPAPTVLIDAGAIADPRPELLAQFAQLGAAYAETAFGITEPRVGLLTIGAEPGKGNRLARRGYEELNSGPPHGGLPFSFVGNVEADELLSGRVDVIVTDGFTGNVALKAVEGSARFAAAQLREVLDSSRAARLGALLQRRRLHELAARFDSETYGGAALLGLEGTVVIAHGAVTARGAAAACRLAAELTRARITERIRERLGPARGGHFLRRGDRGDRGGGATAAPARPAGPE